MAKYFQSNEFDCKCGCGKNNIDPVLVTMLDLIREHAGMPPGIPLIITSGCRCTKHNKAIGGSENSSHLTGHAVDIKAYSSETRFKIIASALLHGINRIGVGKNFIHLDNDKTKPANVFWIY